MKKFWKSNKEKILLLLIVSLGAFLRFYNLNWDQGHYLHPDERLYVNSSDISFPKTLTEFLSPDSPLNPDMFYYGTFPLYIYKVVNIFVFPSLNFTIVSRIVSSILSILTIPLIYLLARQFFSKKTSILAAIIFAFASGSIQHAHFNTTESILTFLLTLITLLSISIAKQKNYVLALILGILIGIAYATKIVGLTFALIPTISFIILAIKRVKMSKIILLIFTFTISAAITGLLFAPYQVIDFEQFSREQSYMQNVTYGNDKPPFVIIYEKTIPYAYQITKIFPFTFGFISFPLALLGLYFILKNFFKEKTDYLYVFLIAYPILYFLWSGAWFVKFSRYYILLFPFLSVWTAYALGKLKKLYIVILLSLIALNGIVFMRVYFKENTRIQASEWIYKNIPNQSKITGEHWDDNLPLPIINTFGKNFLTSQLAVYDQDSPEKISKLSEDLAANDYFIISSRRVYYSILKNKDKYPLTSNFYKLLFEEKLGYKLEKTFTNYPFYFSDDFADESFQSYDHPPVYIFINTERLQKNELANLIKNR
jgi:4-amino-4-deoxy-L-arabinose transferase-like glycosyltransferase